jgi:hypothetical protein
LKDHITVHTRLCIVAATSCLLVDRMLGQKSGRWGPRVKQKIGGWVPKCRVCMEERVGLGGDAMHARGTGAGRSRAQVGMVHWQCARVGALVSLVVLVMVVRV